MVGPEFGNWLAGFTDGEGCFTVEAYRGRASHSCSFTIALRVDDKSILDECQLRTGLEDGRRLADWSFLALARENLMTGRAAPDLPY